MIIHKRSSDFLGHLNLFLALLWKRKFGPNLFYQLKQQQIPFIIPNARLAEKSLHGYKKLKFFFAPILQNASIIAAQSSLDADHFKQLGVNQR